MESSRAERLLTGGRGAPLLPLAMALPAPGSQKTLCTQEVLRRAEHVLEYLGRYTHRVAISNNRLLNFADGHVDFKWKDYRQDSQPKVMQLDAAEFVRRFLLHGNSPTSTVIALRSRPQQHLS